MLGSAVLTSRQPRHRTCGRTHRAWKGGGGGGVMVGGGVGEGRRGCWCRWLLDAAFHGLQK